LSSLIAASVLLFTRSASAETASAAQHKDYVVLLHGMDRTALSMKRLESYLAKQGYRVINLTYPSRRFSVEQLSENFLQPLLDQRITDHNCSVHFVTHSLGGIIVRQYLANHALTNVGRVVMLAPPNHGSEIIDHLRAHAFTRNFLSPAGRELGTSENDLPAKLGPVKFECGVIAGDRSLNPFLSAWLSGPNDGKVTVESAKVPGMRDFLSLPYSHTWLMWRKTTLCQTLCFLQSGHFCA
jgi:pimeloyl-ACP methyl ester carboxylesterase